MNDFKDITVKIKEEKENSGLYEISPLPRGYGNTLANSLRRVLLSSLSGGGITQVKFPKIEHEYSTLPGVKEDVLEILMNLKTLNFKIDTDEPQTCKLSYKGEGVVKGSDIKLTGGVEIMNGEQVIANLTDKSSVLEFELKIEKGVGYKEVKKDERKEKGVLQLDADFSPVLNVTYEVLQARKGQQMNLDSVFFTIMTDGSITPVDALLKASEILQDFAGKVMIALGMPINEVEQKAEEARTAEVSESEAEAGDELDSWKIEDLQLSKRSKTGLLAGGYKTIGDLKGVTRAELLGLPGFGNKSFNEIYELLKEYNIEIDGE
jgi:DNA-directed RNA polymerase subunit alpha